MTPPTTPSDDPSREGLRGTVRRAVDPRLWVHLLKLARYWSYAHVEPRRRLQAGPGLRMSPLASLRNGERITLGSNVHVGERCYLWAGNSTGRITLGDHVLLAPEVFITASNYGTAYGTPVMHQAKREADVVIGADVWLGARVVVLPGVTIGDGAVVGAGSIVSRSLPAQCIAVGSPARVVGWREGYEVPDGAEGDVVGATGGGPVDLVRGGADDRRSTRARRAS